MGIRIFREYRPFPPRCNRPQCRGRIPSTQFNTAPSPPLFVLSRSGMGSGLVVFEDMSSATRIRQAVVSKGSAPILISRMLGWNSAYLDIVPYLAIVPASILMPIVNPTSTNSPIERANGPLMRRGCVTMHLDASFSPLKTGASLHRPWLGRKASYSTIC